MNLLRDTSWDALHACAEFAEDGNFTRAAARLHISQPALHTKIANLARTLQVELYVRRGRHLEITPAGRKVQRFARELAAGVAEFQAELRDSNARQPVVLCAGAGSYLYLLGEGLRRFRMASQHPLRLETGDRTAAVEAVLGARAQVGVASLESPPAGLQVRSLTKVGQVLVMPSRHPLAAPRTHLAQRSAGCPSDRATGRQHRVMLVHMLQSADIHWHIAMATSGWDLMLQFVRLGLGLAVVNACVLTVAAAQAAAEGVLFYLANPSFWLAKAVPARYISWTPD